MFDSFIYSLSAVAPIIFMILLGKILSKKTLPQSFFDFSDTLVYKFALPVFVFCKLVSADLSDLPDTSLIFYCVAIILLAFITVSLISHPFLPREKRGAFIHGSFRANFSIIGFVLADTMLTSTGVVALACVTPFVLIISNVLAVTTLTVNAPREHREPFGKFLLKLLKNIATTPLIIGVLLSLPFMIFGIKLPQIAMNSLTYLANIATPLALLSLGAINTNGEKYKIIPSAVVATAIKLIVVPIVYISLAILLGFRGDALAVILILGASPTAVTSYVMAKKMHGDGELARQIVLFTTVLCSLTIFIFAFILKYLQLI